MVEIVPCVKAKGLISRLETRQLKFDHTLLVAAFVGIVIFGERKDFLVQGEFNIVPSGTG